MPITFENSMPPHMPCATTSRNCDERAYSGSTWVGFMSPEMMANIWMSSGRSVRTSVATIADLDFVVGAVFDVFDEVEVAHGDEFPVIDFLLRHSYLTFVAMQ